MVTGRGELEIKDLQDKLGSMQGTTKCCATGTCGIANYPRTQAPSIPVGRDSRDPVAISRSLGKIT